MRSTGATLGSVRMATNLTGTNLRVLARSRRAPTAGDVFVMQLADGRYLFGRVILADLSADRAPMPGSNLIYVYRELSESKGPRYEALGPNNLLVPPLFTNRLGWVRGVFETVEHGSVNPSDMLEQHCFEDVFPRRFVDERGAVLGRRIEPCGTWGLQSYRAIDDQIADALAIPRAPVALDDLRSTRPLRRGS